MKIRKTKKGFTIVELVIVVAVIGILAAVLIPTFVNLTNKANETSDDALVKNLNTSLQMAEEEQGKKNDTFQEAIDDLKDFGYLLPNLMTRSDKKLLYRIETNRFVLDSKKEAGVSDVEYWEIVNEIPIPGEQKYSMYPGTKFSTAITSVGLTVGFDAGERDQFTSITYDRSEATDEGQTAVIRTNGGILTINAENDEVTHYGQVDYVDIIAVKPASYEERGTTSLIKVAKGNVALNSESKVGEIHFAKTGDVFTDIKVTLENGAQLPDLSRDPVGTSSLDNVLICEVVTSGTSEFYWLNAKGTIEDGEVLVSSTKNGDKTAATAENSTAVAIANAKSGETVTDNGATVKPASEMTAEELVEATAMGAARTFAEIGSKEELVAFRDAWNEGKLASGGNYKLVANIDVSESNWYPIGTWEFPFNGTFDGNNKTINGLTANSTDVDHIGMYANGDTVGAGETYGFFGIVGGGNTIIQNVSFTNVQINIYNGKDVAAVVGYVPSLSKFKAANASGSDKFISSDKWTDESGVGTHSLKLENIAVSGSVKGSAHIGGIAGKVYTSGKVEVINCTNSANITGGSNTAGVVGYIYYSNDITVSGCTNTGTVKLTGGAGIVHLNDLSNKKIINNTNTGDIIYDKAYSKTSSNSYSWDFIVTGSHAENGRNYSEYHGNVNSGKFYVQDNQEPENTKGVLIVDAGETVTISSVSEYTDVVVYGTLNINANTNIYGCMWVESTGIININAELSVAGTQGYLNLRNNSLTVGENGSVSAIHINIKDNFTLTNNGTIHIKTQTEGLKKNNLTFVNNGTFIAESNMYYGDGLHFTNNGTYQGNMLLTGNATIINNENGKYEAHNGNGIDFRGGSGSFTNHAESPFGAGFDGVSIWVAGTYTIEGCNAHLGSGVTNLNLTHEDNTWTATNK